MTNFGIDCESAALSVAPLVLVLPVAWCVYCTAHCPSELLASKHKGVAMKRLMFGAVVVVIGLSAASAYANQYLIHGSSCFPTSTNPVIHGSYGVTVGTGSPAVDVICPLHTISTAPATATVTFQMNAWDRSSTDDVYCSLFVTNNSGATLSVLAVSTSGASIPEQSAATTTGGYANNQFFYIQCHIPAVDTLGGSYLNALYVTSSN